MDNHKIIGGCKLRPPFPTANVDFNKILFFLLIANPLIWWTGVDVASLRHIIYVLSCIVLIGTGLISDKIREFKNKYIIGLVAIAIALLFKSGFNPAVFNGTVSFLLGTLAYISIYQHANIDKVQTGKVFFIITLFNVCLMSLQFINFDPIFTHVDNLGFITERARMTGFELNTTYTAFFLLLGACFLPLTLLIVLAPFIISTKAMVAIVASAILICVRFYPKFRKNNYCVFYLTCIFLSIAWFAISNYDYILAKIMLRWAVWGEVLRYCFQNYLGMGIGIWSLPEFSKIFTERIQAQGVWLSPHNDYISSLLSFGVGGGVLMFLYLKNIILRNLYTPLGLAVCCYLFCSLMQSYVHFYSLTLIIISILSLKEIENHDSF